MAIVFAIIIFSFLIFIHELGHFLAAKASGVQVNEFALFMGPAILKWQRRQPGGSDWEFCWPAQP